MISLLHSVDAQVLTAGVHQGQSSVVPDVVVGHVELLQASVLVEPLGKLAGPCIAHAHVHQGQLSERLVPWQGVQQTASPGLQQGVITQATEGQSQGTVSAFRLDK